MKRLALIAAVLAAASCSNRTDGALKVRVTLADGVGGDCVELTAGQGAAVLDTASATVTKGRAEYVFGVKQGALPATVTLTASTWYGACQDRAGRKLAARSTPVEQTFPTMGVVDVGLPVARPDGALDVDRDGYIDVAKGGNDCNDARTDINPGAKQVCGSVDDADCDGVVGCADSDCASAQACAHPGTALAFDPATATPVLRGDCSAAFTVALLDAAGQPTVPERDLPVSLEPANATLTVYRDAACTGAPLNGPLTLPQGQSRTPALYVKGSAAGDVNLVARAQAVTAATLAVHVLPRPVASLAFTTAEVSPRADTCSAPLTVQLLDALGQATTAASDLTLWLTATDALGQPAQGFTFHGVVDATCDTAILEPASLTLPAGQSTASFRVRATRAALPHLRYTVKVEDTAPHTVTQGVNVVPGPAAKVVFLSAPQTPQVNKCSNAVRVQLRDAQDNATTASGALALSLDGAPVSATGGVVSIFDTAGCGTAALNGGAFTIGNGVASRDLYVRASVVGTYLLRVQGPGTDTQALSVAAGPPTHLVISSGGGQTVAVDACSARVAVQAQDATNVMSGPQADAPITIGAPSDVQVFDGAGCLGAPVAGNTLTLPAGQGEVYFSFKATVAGVGRTLSASTTTPGITSASTTATITAGPPDHLTWGATPAQVAAGDCSGAFTLKVEDRHANATSFPSAVPLDLATNPDPAGAPRYSLDSACATTSAQLPVAAGASTVTLYAKGTLASATPYAITGGMGPRTTTSAANLLVVPNAGKVLAFKTPLAASVAAGACQQLDVERRDLSGNASPVTGSAMNVTLAGAIAAGLAPDFFSSSAACGAGTGAITQVAMPVGQALATVWWRGRSVGAGSLSASATGLSTASANVTVTHGPVHHLTLALTPATTIKAGGCVAATAAQQDQFNNAVSAAGTPLNFTATTSDSQAAFFTDTGCATPGGPGFTFAAAQGQSSFGFMPKTKAAATSVTVTPATGAAATQGLAVTADVPDHLAWGTGASSSIVAGTCTASAFSVTVLDRFNNATSYPASSTLALAATPGTTGGPTFSAATNCNGAGPSVTLPANTSTQAIYATGTLVGTYSLSASIGAVATSSTPSLGITPGPGKKLAFLSGLPTITPANACVQVVLEHRDNWDNPTAVTAASGQAVTLGATLAGGQVPEFFALQSACTGAANSVTSPSAVTSVTIPQGSTTTTFWVRGRTVGAAALQASATGFTGASATLTVTHGAQHHLVLALSPTSLKAGACSTATVTRRDLFDNDVTTDNTALSYAATSSDAAAEYLASPSCAAGGAGPAAIPAGQASVTFGVLPKTKATTTVTVAATGLGNGTGTLTVAADVPDHFTWSALAPASVASGQCTATPFTLTVYDRFGNLTAYTGNTTLTVTASPTANAPTFSTQSTCTGAGATVTLPGNASTLSVYATGGLVGTWTLSVAAGAVASTSASNPTFSVTPGTATRLVYTAGLPGTAASNTCIQVDVQQRDAAGNPTPVTAAAGRALTLASTLATGLAPDLYASLADCQGALGQTNSSLAITTVTIPQGSSGTSFWARGRGASATAATVQASATGLTAVTGNLTVTSGAQHHLALSLSTATAKAGDCVQATLIRQDFFNNAVTTDGNQLLWAPSSSDAQAAFFASTTGCTGGAPGAIPGNQSTLQFGVMPKTKATGTTVTATPNATQHPGVTAGQATLNVGGGTPAGLVFLTTPPASQTSGVCSGAVTVELRDAFNNATAPTANYALNLSSAGGTAWTFSTGSTCTGATTTATILSGQSSVSFSFKAWTQGVGTLTATSAATSTITVSQSWNIAAGAPSRLDWKTAPGGTLPRSTCASAAAVVRALDAGGNEVPFPAMTLKFTSSAAAAGVQFYDDGAACVSRLGTSPVTRPVSAGTMTVPVMLAALGSGTTQLAAADNAGTLTASGNAAVNVTGARGALSVSPASADAEAGGCVAVTVGRADAAAAPVALGVTPVSLSTGASTDATFHGTSACDPAAPITTTSIPDGASQVVVYARGRGGAPTLVTLTATDADNFFTAGTGTLNALPLVRRGTLNLATLEALQSVPVPIPGADLSRSFLVFQARVDGADVSDTSVTCDLVSTLGTAYVQCHRSALLPTPAAVVEWQVVSFGDKAGVSVQHFGNTEVGTSGASLAQPLTPVADTASFLLFSHAALDTAVLSRDFATARLGRASGSTGPYDRVFVDFSAAPSSSFSWSAQVVTFQGAVVDQGQTGPLALERASVTGLPARTVGRLLPLISSRAEAWAGAPGAEPTESCKHRWRLRAPGATQLDFARGGVGENLSATATPACIGAATEALQWQRIEFPAGTTVANATPAVLTTNATSVNVPISAVTQHRAISLLGGMGPSGMAGGETTNEGSNLGFSTATTTFSSNTNVVLTRGAAGGAKPDSVFTVFVVQFNP